MRVGVIGAGPSGIMAAISASQNGARVILFDANPRIGKKFILTGSGRCNLTNAHSAPQRYATDDDALLVSAWQQFSQPDLVEYLNQIGLALYATEDGWYYPRSNSAANVVEMLGQILSSAGVEFQLEKKIETIHPTGYGFKLVCMNENKPFYVDSLIIACGGKAYPQTGSDGNLNGAIRELGHTILPSRPALAPMLLEDGVFDDLRGVRLDVGCSLLLDGKEIGSTLGNVIFTEWGINGPGVMDLSYLVENAEKNHYQLRLNFIAGNEDLLRDLLTNARERRLEAQAAYLALLPQKVVRWGFSRAGIADGLLAEALSTVQMEELLSVFAKSVCEVKGVKGYKYAQCSWGGVPAREVEGFSMQSKILPGVYFAGEVLNVVGPCGGYNLHWALVSGLISGRAAALREGLF